MEQNPRALDFFMGVAVGILGNFVVSSITEFANGVFENSPSHVLAFWGLMFMVSATSAFYITKVALIHHNMQRNLLAPFDFAMISSVAIGTYMMVYAYTHEFLSGLILMVFILSVRYVIYRRSKK